VLRRLIKASAIVIGTGLLATGCAVTPVKMGAAAIVGNQRISIAALDTQVTNLTQAVSQAARQFPGVVKVNASQQTQSTLSFLIQYQIFEKLARQQGITISPAQADAALQTFYKSMSAEFESEGLANATHNLDMIYYGIPPDLYTELGQYQAIGDTYLKIANGGTVPTSSSSPAYTKLGAAECQAAKALNILVNPQFGQLDYSNYQVVTAAPAVTRSQGPVTKASPVATAPAC
jgi:SurA N-terminal domain